VTHLDLLCKYLLIVELRFDAMLCSNMGNENSDAGHIWLEGRNFPTPTPDMC